jgi:hypothetical protein
MKKILFLLLLTGAIYAQDTSWVFIKLPHSGHNAILVSENADTIQGTYDLYGNIHRFGITENKRYKLWSDNLGSTDFDEYDWYGQTNGNWLAAPDITNAGGGSGYADSVTIDSRHVPGDSLYTKAEVDAMLAERDEAYFDTLSFTWGVMDTVINNEYWDAIQVANNIRIVRITGYADTGLVTFKVFYSTSPITVNPSNYIVDDLEVVTTSSYAAYTESFNVATVAKWSYIIVQPTSVIQATGIRRAGVMIHYVKN